MEKIFDNLIWSLNFHMCRDPAYQRRMENFTEIVNFN